MLVVDQRGMVARLESTTVIICDARCSGFSLSLLLHEAQAAMWGESTGAVCSAPGVTHKQCASTSLNLDKSLDSSSTRCTTGGACSPASSPGGRRELWTILGRGSPHGGLRRTGATHPAGGASPAWLRPEIGGHPRSRAGLSAQQTSAATLDVLPVGPGQGALSHSVAADR